MTRPTPRSLRALTTTLLLFLSVLPLAGAQGPRNSETTATGADERRSAVGGRMRALESLASATDDDALRRFADEHLAPAYRAERSERELLDLLAGIRKVSATAGMITVAEDAEGTRVRFRGAFSGDVVFQLEDAAPFRIRTLALDTDVVPERADREPAQKLEWGAVPARLKAAEKEGFSGTVLLVRDGEVVLHQGYGLADREHGRAATTETIYCIGSLPIDFTRAAVLLLAQQGKLDLADAIGRFFPEVPEDKRAMTLEHLMMGRSGLPNFHHRPGTDADYDLSWIDRESALRRIMEQPLLFPPGSGQAHSHSAFVLLAAVVELVSDKSYGDFLRTSFFEPAGMKRTGFYGEDLGYGVEEFAVGYGESPVGDPNVPPEWGPTSWLVKGSGGMFSTPADMERFFTTLRQGKVLTGEYLTRYLHRGAALGASDRGFYFVRAWDGDDTMVFFVSNVLGGNPDVEPLGDALARLVLAEGGP
jgi:CubicO group peptidase (beta-lactamase class C family)